MNQKLTIFLVVIIVVLLITSWVLTVALFMCKVENKRLVQQQATIDRAILEGLDSIYDAMPQPVQYVEVEHE